MLAALVLGSAVLAPLALLYYFRAQHWYWHALSVLAALALGSISPPPPIPDLLLASVFAFLMLWGVAAPFFRVHAPRAQEKA